MRSSTSGMRILLIDDDHELVDLVKDGLEYGGYEVVAAHDGETGLEMVGAFQPELILLDLQLPVMNGTSFLSKLADMKKEIPVIVITAYGESPLAAEAKQMGVRQILHKPLTMQQLENAVQGALGSG